MTTSLISSLLAARIEWLGVRSDLRPVERRRFERWLARARPELTAPFAGNPALLRETVRELSRTTNSRSAIGLRTLERHAAALAAAFLRSGAGRTFRDFLEDVVRSCATEAELNAFLQT